MMVLHLSCRNYGIGLELPTTYAEAANRLSALREGLDRPAPVQISGVSGPVPNLYPYIQQAGLESEAEIQKLNALAEKIDRMTPLEQQIFSGALEAENAARLDNVLSIADSLEQYELLPQIKTDEELGRFLVETSSELSFPKEVQPYLDYAKIGLEQRGVSGGAHTQNGYVKRREMTPELSEETESAIYVTLSTPNDDVRLGLPCSEEQLSRAKRTLGTEDFADAHLSKLTFAAPGLGALIPPDDFTVEDANTLAQWLQQMDSDELRKYSAVLDVEQPERFSTALELAEDLDDYELVWDNEYEYGRETLRQRGAGDEILEALDGYTDFDQLGRDQMETDGVRQTSFGLVRRLSTPFPPEQECGPQMGGI